MSGLSKLDLDTQPLPPQISDLSVSTLVPKPKMQNPRSPIPSRDIVFQIVHKDDWTSMAVSLSTNTVKLYSPVTGQFMGEYSKGGHSSTINEISFSGHLLHSCSSDGTVRAWDTRSLQQILKEFLGFAEAEVRSLASLYSVMGRNADALALYFGEDPARCPFEQGLCAFSPSLDGCFLALPAGTTKGSVLVYNVMDLHSHCEYIPGTKMVFPGLKKLQERWDKANGLTYTQEQIDKVRDEWAAYVSNYM